MNTDFRTVEEEKRFEEIARRAERVPCNCYGGWLDGGDECRSCDGLGELVMGEPYRDLYEAQEVLDELVTLGRKIPRGIYFWTPGQYPPAKNGVVWVATRHIISGLPAVTSGSWNGTYWELAAEYDPQVIRWRAKEETPDFPADVE